MPDPRVCAQGLREAPNVAASRPRGIYFSRPAQSPRLEKCHQLDTHQSQLDPRFPEER